MQVHYLIVNCMFLSSSAMDTLAVDWWKFGDLARDIYIHLRLKELESSLYPFQSRGQKWRRYLVDALAVTCDVKKFCDRTLHLAVHMLDVFMDRQPSESADPLQQIAVGCLWIAGESPLTQGEALCRDVH